MWPVDPADPGALASANVTALVGGRDGPLWIGTDAGLHSYDARSDRLSRLPVVSASTRRPVAVTALCIDGAGQLWLGTADGALGRWDARAGSASLRPIGSGSSTAITALAPGRDGAIWVGRAGGGVARWDARGGRISEQVGSESLPSGSVRALFEDRSGVLWVGTDGGLVRRAPSGSWDRERLQHVPADRTTPSSDRITALWEDRGGTLWIGTENGLNHMGPKRDRFTRYAPDPAQPETTATFPGTVTSLWQDAGGVLWVGSRDGVRRLPELSRKFNRRPITTATGDPWTFVEGPDRVVWSGTYRHGLMRIDRRAGLWTLYPSLGEPGAENFVELTSEFSTVQTDRNGVVWFAAANVGLGRFDPRTGEHKIYAPDAKGGTSGPPVARIHRIVEHRGYLWLGTWLGGLVQFDPVKETFIDFRAGEPGQPSGDAIYALVVNRFDPNILWVGYANDGLDRFDIARQTAMHIPLPTERRDRPTSIYWIHQDERGALWLGTDEKGLLRIDPARGDSSRFGVAEGIPPAHLYAVLPDKRGRLWLPTPTHGLVVFDPVHGKSVRFGRLHGIENEFAQVSAYRSPSGEFMMSGASGSTMFYPETIEPDRYAPPVALTQVKVKGAVPQLDRPVWTGPQIELGFRDSAVSFEFAALSFAAPDAIRYQYKLEGVDAGWIDTTRPFADYRNLPPGDYRFSVRAANAFGVASQTAATVSMSMAVPPWRTWYAYTLYGLLALGLVLLALRAHSARLRNLRQAYRLASAEHDLELTAAVQAGFLPSESQIQAGPYRLAGFNRAAERASGDWWWYEADVGGNLTVLVGDVTGHGPGPAMITAAAAATIQLGRKHGRDLARRFLDLHDEIQRIARDKYYLMLSAVVLDPTTGAFEAMSAGGQAPMCVTREGVAKLVPCRGAPLGSGTFSLGSTRGQLSPGDRLVLFTDGIPELPLAGGPRIVGMRRFAQMCGAAAPLPIDQAAAQVIRDAEVLQAGVPLQDDWTLVFVEYS